jgi:hypothetical protein
VIEAVDGFPGSPNTWLHSLHAAHYLDREILAGRMAPTVVIFPYQYTSLAHDGECVNAEQSTVEIGVAVDDTDGYHQLLAFTAAARPPLQLTTVTVRQGGHTGGVWIVLEPSVYDRLSGWLAAPERGPANRGE